MCPPPKDQSDGLKPIVDYFHEFLKNIFESIQKNSIKSLLLAAFFASMVLGYRLNSTGALDFQSLGLFLAPITLLVFFTILVFSFIVSFALFTFSAIVHSALARRYGSFFTHFLNLPIALLMYLLVFFFAGTVDSEAAWTSKKCAVMLWDSKLVFCDISILEIQMVFLIASAVSIAMKYTSTKNSATHRSASVLGIGMSLLLDAYVVTDIVVSRAIRVTARQQKVADYSEDIYVTGNSLDALKAAGENISAVGRVHFLGTKLYPMGSNALKILLLPAVKVKLRTSSIMHIETFVATPYAPYSIILKESDVFRGGFPPYIKPAK